MIDLDHLHLFILCDNCGRRLKSEVGGPAAGARQVFDPGGGGLNLPAPSSSLPLSSIPPSDSSIVALPLVAPASLSTSEFILLAHYRILVYIRDIHSHFT